MSDKASRASGDWASFKARLRKIYIATATCALVACLIAIAALHTGWLSLSYQPQSVAAIAQFGWDCAAWLVKNSGEIVRVGAFALLAYALFKAAMNIEKIFLTVNAFNTARSPIAQLQQSVESVRGTAEEFGRNMGALQAASASLNEHAPAIAELNKKLAELSEQVFQMKVDVVSQRAEETPADAGESAPESPRAPRPDEENWEELRSIWRRNILRLESIIKDRLAGPKKKKYDNYSRHNYTTIIDKLFSDNVLSGTAHEKSKKLNEVFRSYKSRRAIVTDEVVGAMRVLDEQLENEVGVIRGSAPKLVEEVD